MEIALKPFYQFGAVVLLNIVALLIARPGKADGAWVISGIAYAFFILLNAILIFWADTHWRYFFVSLACSLLYIGVASLVVPGYIKFFNVSGSGESGMIFLIIMYHPIVLLVSIFIKAMFAR
jgi:hypothetical protein